MVEKLYWAEFKADWHDTKKEIDKLKSLIKEWKLKKSDLPKIKNYINKDKRIANELYLTNLADKALIQRFVKELKITKPEIFEDLKKHKLVDTDGNLAKIWSGPKWVKFLQIMLNYLSWANLKVDGAYGPNTFWALVQYQKQSNIYKSTTLASVQAFANQNNLWVTFKWNMNETWAPDGIADGRTIFSMFKSITSGEKVKVQEDNGGEEKDKVSNKPTVSNKVKIPVKEKNKNVESKNLYIPVGYVKDGNYYILSKNGEPKLVTFRDLSPEIKEKLETMKDVGEKIALLNFLIQSIKESSNWHISKKTFKKAEKDISELVNKVIDWKLSKDQANQEIQNIIVGVFGKWTSAYEIGKYFKNFNWELLRLKVLEFVRKNLGKYNLTATNILNKNFDVSGLSSDFVNKLSEAVEKGMLSKIEKLLKENPKVKEWLKHNDVDIKDFAQNMLKIWNKVNEAKKKLDIKKLARQAWMTPEKYEELLNKMIIKTTVKKMLFDQFVDSITDNMGKVKNTSLYSPAVVKELNLYSDIEGFWIWNMADSSKDIAQLILETVLIEIAAMWVGALTGGLWAAAVESLAIARWTKRWYEAVELAKDVKRFDEFLNIIKVWDTSYRVGKTAKLTYSLAKVWVEWALFYEWANFVQNFFEWRDLFEWVGDMKEILKSMIMIWVFHWLNKLYDTVPGLKNLKVKEWDSILKKTFKVTGQITLEWISLWAVGGWLDVMLDQGEWTPEMFIEWIIMAALLKWTGHLTGKLIRLRQNNGKVEVEEVKLLEDKTSGKKSNTETETLKKFSKNAKELKWKRTDLLLKQLDRVNQNLARLKSKYDANNAKIKELEAEKAKLEAEMKSKGELIVVKGKAWEKQLDKLRVLKEKGDKVGIKVNDEYFMVTKIKNWYEIKSPEGATFVVGDNLQGLQKMLKREIDNYLKRTNKTEEVKAEDKGSEPETLSNGVEIRVNNMVRKEMQIVRNLKEGEQAELNIAWEKIVVKRTGVGEYEITYSDGRTQTVGNTNNSWALKAIELVLKKEARKNLSSKETKPVEEVKTSQTEEIKLEKIQKEIGEIKSRLGKLKELKKLQDEIEKNRYAKTQESYKIIKLKKELWFEQMAGKQYFEALEKEIKELETKISELEKIKLVKLKENKALIKEGEKIKKETSNSSKIDAIQKEIEKLRQENTRLENEIKHLEETRAEVEGMLAEERKVKEEIKENVESKENNEENIVDKGESNTKDTKKTEELDKELEEQLKKIEWPKETVIWDFKLSEKKFNRVEKEIPIEKVKRNNDVIAIGDTHGNYKAFIKNLGSAGIIDKSWNWIWWNKDVVLLWDILADRNIWSLKTLEKIYELSKQAKEQGWSITLLAWNHDDFAISFLTKTKIAWGGDPVKNITYNWQGESILEFVHYFYKPIKWLKPEERIKVLEEAYKNGEILNKMKKSIEGRKILDVISNYKILEQIDDTLYVHTDFTPKMAELLKKYGVDKINQIYQKWLKDMLFDGKKPSKEFEEVKNTFLYTGNRSYLNWEQAKELKQMWINRIIHGHSDHGGVIKDVWWLQIVSVDRSFGKHGDLDGEPSIWIVKKENWELRVSDSKNIKEAYSLEELTSKIENAKTIDEVLQILKENGWIKSRSGKWYSYNKIEGIIKKYMNNEIWENYITSTAGLRDKITQLKLGY